MILSPQRRGRSTGIGEFSCTLHLCPPLWHFRLRIPGSSINNRRRNKVNPSFKLILEEMKSISYRSPFFTLSYQRFDDYQRTISLRKIRRKHTLRLKLKLKFQFVIFITAKIFVQSLQIFNFEFKKYKFFYLQQLNEVTMEQTMAAHAQTPGSTS